VGRLSSSGSWWLCRGHIGAEGTLQYNRKRFGASLGLKSTPIRRADVVEMGKTDSLDGGHAPVRSI
jgi:hypothetical protein